VLREGIHTAIVGKPNVGKSTLMNMLNGYDRSIVTEVAGTTRDVIESTVMVGDITLHLSDTAGIHETEDEVESIGVQRAIDRIKASQLILAVFDASRPVDCDDIEILEQLDKNNSIVIINKIDLGNFDNDALFEGFRVVKLSAKIKQGYNELAAEIADIAGTANLKEDSVVLINERQRACAARALDGVSEALNALVSGATMDAVGVCVDDAIASLLELTGKRVTNEVCDEIFKRFCVGK
jgi:tRNA modification GTPase